LQTLRIPTFSLHFALHQDGSGDLLKMVETSLFLVLPLTNRIPMTGFRSLLSTGMNATRAGLSAVCVLTQEQSSMIIMPSALSVMVHFHPTKAHAWELQNYAM
jgi:hypothetical protein